MKYCVNIPLWNSVNFPNSCPFSGDSAPRGTVRLKQTKTLLLIPLPGFIYNRYSVTSLRIPASKKIAQLAIAMEILMWASLLGGIALCFLLLYHDKGGRYDGAATLILLGCPFLSLAFRICRSIIVRSVQIRPASNDYVEVRFQSETYAREFSALNRVQVYTD